MHVSLCSCSCAALRKTITSLYLPITTTSIILRAINKPSRRRTKRRRRRFGAVLKYLGGNFAPHVVAHPHADWAVHLVGGGGRRLVAFSIGAHLYVFVDDLCERTYKNTHAGYAAVVLLIYSCEAFWLKLGLARNCLKENMRRSDMVPSRPDKSSLDTRNKKGWLKGLLAYFIFLQHPRCKGQRCRNY